MTPEQLNNNVPKEEARGVREIFESYVTESETHLVKSLLERQKKELQECQLKCQKYAFLKTVTAFYGQLTSRPVRVEHGHRYRYGNDRGINEFKQIGTDSQPSYLVQFHREFRENHPTEYGLLFYKVHGQDKWGMPSVEGIDTDDVCVREDILAQLGKTIAGGKI